MNLHPGVAASFRRLTADELGVAEMMRDGEITSPQRFKHVWMFVLRMTGTGVAYRSNHVEYVFRDPAVFCTPRFLARCNGLPVVWEHPEKAILNSDEFARRIIGSIFLPYVVSEEVWCIAKIWDETAARMMEDGELSTSPGVLTDDRAHNRVTTGEGDDILIEASPSLVDHLAVCVQGVWDKGGEPVGVRVDAEPAAEDSRIDAIVSMADRLIFDSWAARFTASRR